MTVNNHQEEILPNWDLYDLYSSESDPKLEADLRSGEDMAKAFIEKWRSLLISGQYTAEQLAQALNDYEQINVLLSLPSAYADLRFSVESQNETVGALKQRCTEKISSIFAELLFFELELGKIEDHRWDELKNAEVLAQYRHFIEELRRSHQHTLSEAEEKILEQTAAGGCRAFRRLFGELISRLVFPIEIDGQQRSLTQSELLALFHDPDRKVRRQAAKVLSEVLQANAHPIHFTYNTLLLDKLIKDKLRGFATPESSRNLDNELSDSTVNMVIEVVKANYHIVAEYYRLKADYLNLPQLYHYDRYAPLGQTDEIVSYKKAEQIVLESFGEFDPKFKEMAQRFFDGNWIDAKVCSGKRGGAFCAGIVPKIHPYIMLNFTGRLRDVQTMAHELGHGLHDLLASKQNLFNFHPVLPLAETASTFAEMIVFEKLFSNLSKTEDKLILLASKIEDTFATVFRQVSMYTFEQRVFAARAQEGELSLERINEIWQQSIGEMFGDSLYLGEDHAITWLYVPHFVYTPFYVYAYAFGELLVYSLFARYHREGEAFKAKYLKFLASGGCKTPRELLAELDIDIDNRQFWQDGCDLIAANVEKARALIDELKGRTELNKSADDNIAPDVCGEDGVWDSGRGWGDGDEDGWDGQGEDEIIDPSERGF
ncbi:MAG: M3 family oligoendopeptidase [Candidatus Bruticola sp.]